MMLLWREKIQTFDERRNIIVPGDHAATIQFCAELFLTLAADAIEDHGYFAVALSGGSTPKAIYQKLALPVNQKAIDWKRVLLFWSDERCVPKSHPDSNYLMAMSAGFSHLPIPKENIFPMECDNDLKVEKNAKAYENLILTKIPSQNFDLVMLGMGEDGHTASLFPKTHALHTNAQLVVPNYIPEKEVWRMTLTFDCINAARHTHIYVLGANKAKMVKKVLYSPYDPDQLPIQRVGTPSHKALWLLDRDAATDLQRN